MFDLSKSNRKVDLNIHLANNGRNAFQIFLVRFIFPLFVDISYETKI
jgi:hypothetical protein